jgi:plasmid stabilization system protein ParE
MGFRVELTTRAQEDIREIFEWIREAAAEAAVRWYLGLLVKLATLEQFPTRCSRAPESDIVQRDIRQIYYGRRPKDWFRALFEIQGDVVYVLRVRRCSQSEIPKDEIFDDDVKQ